jgi:NAD(P)-dependent dehydrogenase (short-subunit alcohol dehydrogenase family)
LKDGFSGVVLVDRQKDALDATAHRLKSFGQVASLPADLVADETAVQAVDLATSTFGRLDVLFNAAGNTARCGLEDTTAAHFQQMFDVNVKAPLFMMQQAAIVMKAQKSGVIINVASMLAHGGPPNLATYAASKSALVTLTKSAANTWKRDGIRCFVINLGWANTDGEHKLQTGFHQQPQDWADRIGSRMPFGRLINSQDVAGLCAFLVSDPASMMTGAVIDYEQMPVGVFDEHPALARE